MNPTFWLEVQRDLEAAPQGTVLEYLRDEVPHPQTQGAVRSKGWPVGQEEDWRFPPTPSCQGVHAQAVQDSEGREVWRVHLDQVAPQCSVVRHMAVDAPQSLILACAAVATGAGYMLGPPRLRAAGAFGGGVLGLLVGAVMSASIQRSHAQKAR
jgi:hypothetical protein